MILGERDNHSGFRGPRFRRGLGSTICRGWRIAAFTAHAVFLAGCGQASEPRGVHGSNKPLTSTLVISDSPIYDFGVKPLSTVTTKTFTVTNTGAGPATEISGSFHLSTTFGYQGGSYPGNGGTCGNFLGSLEACTVVVAFTPEYSGHFEEVLRLNYHNGQGYKQTSAPTLRGDGS